MSYIALINESQFTGTIIATSISFYGTVDFTEASPIIGLVDDSTIELITNPISGFLKNIIQVKDAGITNVKIVSMDSTKLTGNISIAGSPAKILFNITLNMQDNDIINTGDIIPNTDSTYTLGTLLKRWYNIYSSNGFFEDGITTPIVNNSLGVEIQYNNNTVLETTMSGLTITGSVIINGSSLLLSGNIYPSLDITYTSGLSLNRWLTTYSKNIDSSDGVNLKFNNSTKISTTTNGVVLAGQVDMNNNNVVNGSTATFNTSIITPIINNATGVSFQYNGSTKITSVNNGLTLYGDIIPDSNNSRNLGSAAVNFAKINTYLLNGAAGIGLQFNDSTKMDVVTSGIRMSSQLDMNNNNIVNAISITQTTGNTLTIGNNTADSKIVVSFGSNTNDALYISNLSIKNKKIVLYDGASNNNEYYGFGINGGILRYQVSSTGDNHVFYCALNSTTSAELFRFNYTANLCSRPLNMNSNNITNAISITQASGSLTIGNTADGTSVICSYGTGANDALYCGGLSIKRKKLVIRNAANNEHQFSGFGNVSGMSYQVPGTSDSHEFYCGNGSSTSNLLLKINNTEIACSKTLNLSTNNLTNGGSAVFTSITTPIINHSGGVSLQYNGSTKISTNNLGIQFASASTIDLNTSNLANGAIATFNTSVLTPIIDHANGVEIRYALSTKVKTVNSGAIVTGTTKTDGIVVGHRSTTINTTLTETDCIISANPSGGTFTITLPLISGLTYSAGRQYTIKNITNSRKAINITPTAPNLLDGKSRYTINTPYAALNIYCDGTNWYIF